jgi:hypothetical protein
VKGANSQTPDASPKEGKHIMKNGPKIKIIKRGERLIILKDRAFNIELFQS